MERAVVEIPKRWRLRLAAQVTAPREARDFVGQVCASGNAEECSELGQLVISELVSNAVRYSGTAIEIEVRLESDQLWLCVHDDGAGMPMTVPPGSRTVGGVGLELVSRVSSAWGVTPDPRGGKDVWCVLPAGGTANGTTPPFA
jgi:anti-sigma regulatory factor (Ser/Thr protein kinase)